MTAEAHVPVSTPPEVPSAPAVTSSGVTIQGLTKTFGSRTVVERLDLAIEPGELVSLLGPSGCGKTTTLRMIAGFLAGDAGRIDVDGRDIVGLPPERRPTAMVFQNYALWPHMSVFKNIAYPLKLRRLPRQEIEKRVCAVLDLVNLGHHRGSRPATISGGEQQRVALARALVQEPKVLLLDEPLSNLDAKLRVKVREDIRQLQQRLGITTLLVTHDQDEALSMSDRIAVMNGGRIEQFSRPDELYRDPRTEFVAGFVGTLNRIEGRVVEGRVVAVPGLVTAVRPEDVRLTPLPSGADDRDRLGAAGPGGRPNLSTGTVTQVVPRGAFHEVVVDAGTATLRSMQLGVPARVGDRVAVAFTRQMLFRAGAREDAG